MCVPSDNELYYESCVELAVTVFKTQNQALIESLKNFLLVLPSPKWIEEVLIAAIYQLAETDPEAYRWLLSNSCYLEPELDLKELEKAMPTLFPSPGLILD